MKWWNIWKHCVTEVASPILNRMLALGPLLATMISLSTKDSNHATVAFRCLQAKMMLEDKLQGKRLSFSGRMLLGDNPRSTHRAP